MKIINRIIRKTKNLISWLPIIFKDENWDHSYIYIVLRHKLKRTLKCLDDFEYCDNISAKRHLKICIKLLDRIIEDDFYEPFESCGVTFEDVMKDISPETSQKILDRSTKANNLKKKYIKTLFNILENRIESFWC